MKSLGAILVLLCTLAAHAESDGIWFLHLRMTNGQVALVERKKSPGVFKSRRDVATSRGVQVELRAADGTALWSQTIDDPTVRRIEFADPQSPGQIRSREIAVTNAEFTVRVPFHSRARMAVLSRPAVANTNAVARTVASPARVEFGRVTLKPEEAP